jgi:hypothetical protein
MPPSPKSAKEIDNKAVFSFDIGTNNSSKAHQHLTNTANNKSLRARMSVDLCNKENFKIDIFNKFQSSNGRRASSYSNGCNNNNNINSSNIINKKERRSFKCERLSNIFSRDSSNKEKEKINCVGSAPPISTSNSTAKSRKINSAPVYRKHSNQNKFATDEMSSSSSSSSANKSKCNNNNNNNEASQTNADMTMFPFDREAIDYERIQRECFAVEEEYDNDEDDEDDYDDVYLSKKSSFPYEYEDNEDSPSYEMLDKKIAPLEGIFQQYALISQYEKDRLNKKRTQSPTTISSVSTTTSTAATSSFTTTANESSKSLSKIKHINRKLNETSVFIHDQPANSNVTSPIPDLKIDFFTEPSLASSFSRENENVKCDAELDGCQLNTTSSSGCKNTMSNNNVNSNINGSINLTSNPMSTAVCTPRATIVVQQVCFFEKENYHNILFIFRVMFSV